MDIIILGLKPEILPPWLRQICFWVCFFFFPRVGRELGPCLDVPRGAGEEAATHTSCLLCVAWPSCCWLNVISIRPLR